MVSNFSASWGCYPSFKFFLWILPEHVLTQLWILSENMLTTVLFDLFETKQTLVVQRIMLPIEAALKWDTYIPVSAKAI